MVTFIDACLYKELKHINVLEIKYKKIKIETVEVGLRN